MKTDAAKSLASLSEEEIRSQLGPLAQDFTRQELLLVARFVDEVGSLEGARKALAALGAIRRAA